MPTYQYRCADCRHDLEAVQKFSDAALTECPNCAGQLRKVYNAVGVVFKGSGFYSTDNRGGSAKAQSNGSTNGSTNGSSDGSESKSSGSESGSSAGSPSSSSGSTSSAPAKAAAD